MARRKTVKTHEQVKQEFRDAGVSVLDWSRANGFNPRLVYTLLNDRRPAVRGESHRIAVALGLKRAGAQVGA